jgi:hypothetical protein
MCTCSRRRPRKPPHDRASPRILAPHPKRAPHHRRPTSATWPPSIACGPRQARPDPAPRLRFLLGSTSVSGKSMKTKLHLDDSCRPMGHTIGSDSIPKRLVVIIDDPLSSICSIPPPISAQSYAAAGPPPRPHPGTRVPNSSRMLPSAPSLTTASPLSIFDGNLTSNAPPPVMSSWIAWRPATASRSCSASIRIRLMAPGTDRMSLAKRH